MANCRYCGRSTLNASCCCSTCFEKLVLIRRIRGIGAEWLRLRDKDKHTEELRKYGKIWKGDN